MLAVAVGMNAGGLGENVGSDDRLIGGYPDPRKCFHEFTDLVNGRFFQPDLHLRLKIVQNRNGACHGCISGALTHSVYR